MLKNTQLAEKLSILIILKDYYLCTFVGAKRLIGVYADILPCIA